MITEKNLDIFVKYATNDSEFYTLTAGQPLARELIEDVMNDKLINSLIRERIVSSVLNLRNVTHMHSNAGDTTTVKEYDAYDDTNSIAYEIKTEQHSCKASRTSDSAQVIGTGVFGIQKQNNLDMLINDNPRIAHGAFFNGKLGFITVFDFNDSLASERLQRYLDNRETRNKKTACKYMFNDWNECAMLAYVDWDVIFEKDHYVRGKLRKSLLEMKSNEEYEAANPEPATFSPGLLESIKAICPDAKGTDYWLYGTTFNKFFETPFDPDY